MCVVQLLGEQMSFMITEQFEQCYMYYSKYYTQYSVFVREKLQ